MIQVSYTIEEDYNSWTTPQVTFGRSYDWLANLPAVKASQCGLRSRGVTSSICVEYLKWQNY